MHVQDSKLARCFHTYSCFQCKKNLSTFRDPQLINENKVTTLVGTQASAAFFYSPIICCVYLGWFFMIHDAEISLRHVCQAGIGYFTT